MLGQVTATVMPDRIWLTEPTVSIQPYSPEPEWHAPMLPPDLLPPQLAPKVTYTEVKIIEPWVWYAGGAAVLGLLFMVAR